MTEIILIYLLGMLGITTYLEEVSTDKDLRLDASLALFWPLAGIFLILYNINKLITGEYPND